MCGILAVFRASEGFACAEQRLFNAALDSLQHRGPDDRGTWRDGHAWLGSRRLAIIDLSSAGHQPMVDPESGVTIAFNGEIFNYVELRHELESLGHRFRTQSDTEVLLQAYLQWGAGCLPRLNGMWLFSIWDPHSRTAFVARDRFGVKPGYYTVAHDELIVASEPKAILAIKPNCRQVNKESLCNFLTAAEINSEGQSFYSGVAVLPSAHYAVFRVDIGGLSIQRYWSPPEDRSSVEDDIEQLHALFADAVRLRMRSDVPVGITLSGGLELLKHPFRSSEAYGQAYCLYIGFRRSFGRQ